MPARPPRVQVTTATRSPPALLEMLTLSGAPMPRTTSHSVCPSATDPRDCGGAPAGPSVSALGSAGGAGGGAPRPPRRGRRAGGPVGQCVGIGGAARRRHPRTRAVGTDEVVSPDRLVGAQRRRVDRYVPDE